MFEWIKPGTPVTHRSLSKIDESPLTPTYILMDSVFFCVSSWSPLGQVQMHWLTLYYCRSIYKDTNMHIVYVACITIFLFIHMLTTHCFHLLAFMSNAVKKSRVHPTSEECSLISSGYAPRRMFAGSHRNSVFDSLRNIQTGCHCFCNCLCPSRTQWEVQFPVCILTADSTVWLH